MFGKKKKRDYGLIFKTVAKALKEHDEQIEILLNIVNAQCTINSNLQKQVEQLQSHIDYLEDTLNMHPPFLETASKEDLIDTDSKA